jgi:hypothetical protein
LFDELLVKAGCLPHQHDRYHEPRYTVRGRHIWRVSGHFPRITEGDLRDGVGDCQYRIATANLDEYEISVLELTATLRASNE